MTRGNDREGEEVLKLKDNAGTKTDRYELNMNKFKLKIDCYKPASRSEVLEQQEI